MSHGKWYLVYTHINEMGVGTFREDVEDVVVALKATTETEAVAEARSKWADITKERNAYWEKCKKAWTHPPKGPIRWSAHTPRVIYKIPLQ